MPSPIYAYFNNLLALSLDTTQSSLLQGAVNEDEIFITFVGKTHIDYPTATITFKRSDNTISPELVMQQTSFVYSGTAFPTGTYSNSYSFLFYDDWILAYQGPLEATVRLYGISGNILVSGKITLSVQPSVFSPETTITPQQYTDLLLQISQLTQNAEATKITLNVRNDEATAITKGMPVYIFSTLGASGTLTVKKATADHTVAPIKKLLGVVMDPSIAPNALGNILILGELTGFNTSSLTQGQPIYLGTTSGTLTSTVPTEPNHRIIVGVCAFTNANNGAIYVKQQLGLELGELDDVRITNVQNLQILRYNTANLRWENSSDLPANNVDLQNHINNLSNPHQVTKSQVGLSSVTNDAQIPLTQKGVANGVASLDASAKIPIGQLPNSVFDSLIFYNTYGTSSDVAVFGQIAKSSADAGNRSPIGYYWVASAQITLTAGPNQITGGKYYNTRIYPGDNEATIVNGTTTLEVGDWFILTEYGNQTGTSLDPISVWIAVVNNTYENATTSINGIVRLSNSTSIATTGDNVITDGRLNALGGAANGIATLDNVGLIPLSQIPLLFDDVIPLINSTIYANVGALPTPTSNFYASGSPDRPKAMVLTLFGDPSFQYNAKLYYVVFSGPPTNVYSWTTNNEYVGIGKIYYDITTNTTYRGTGFVGNSTTTSDFLSILNSSILNAKADLINGIVPLTQLPNKVQNTTVIFSNRIYFDLAALTNNYGPNGSVIERRELVVGGNGTSISSIDIYLLPAGTPGNVQGNWILERTLSTQSPFYSDERILCRTTRKLYFVSGFNWGVLSPTPSFVPTDTIDANNFFVETVNGETNFYYDSYVYRIACDQNSFNPNDQTRTFYGLPRKIVIDNIVYTGNIFQIVNNFNQFEDFTITQNGDFFAVMTQNNTNTIVIGTTIFNSSGNWETSQAGNHRITIVKKDALASGTGSAQRIVIIEKI